MLSSCSFPFLSPSSCVKVGLFICLIACFANPCLMIRSDEHLFYYSHSIKSAAVGPRQARPKFLDQDSYSFSVSQFRFGQWVDR
ncbi:hypothetical protein BDY21DRAFT_203669 [Lineolata rhizophorae]|uniref:Uncharacterized protein n=1 Tax=Lineolata rhizophorae TaxID=578093 RepID=A0A6A6P720_9PEZI|nr:hypothetical protein BDY21DRAFT_203669 [Lineolata rhizophorae]